MSAAAIPAGRAAPLRFVALLIAAWIVARTGLGLDWQPPPALRALVTPLIAALSPAADAATRGLTIILPPPLPAPRHAPQAAPEAPASPSVIAIPAPPADAAPAALDSDAREGVRRGAELMLLAEYAAPHHALIGSADAPLLGVAPSPGGDRWSGSAWALLRPGSSPGTLVPALGGSQAGTRIAYRIDRAGRLFAVARGTAALAAAGKEVALGIELRPDPAVPLRAALLRRVAADRAGRDAWELSAAGGIDGMALPAGLRLDGYAEGGVVGARSRDLFADGAARIGQPIAIGGARGQIGAGVWAAAQPGATRLDLGPQAVVRAPAGPSALSVAIDYRVRVAGNARPGSGVALTLGTDF